MGNIPCGYQRNSIFRLSDNHPLGSAEIHHGDANEMDVPLCGNHPCSIGLHRIFRTSTLFYFMGLDWRMGVGVCCNIGYIRLLFPHPFRHEISEGDHRQRLYEFTADCIIRSCNLRRAGHFFMGQASGGGAGYRRDIRGIYQQDKRNSMNINILKAIEL